MNLHDLNYFTTAARLGSVTKAARVLSTVQSNVTARIRGLEEELGTQLFLRNHRGIELTTKGHELMPYAEQVLALVQKAKDRVSGREQNPEGVLRIGSVQSTASARLPELFKDYTSKYRKVDLAVETGMAGELIEKLLDFRIEGAFVSGSVDRPGLNIFPAFVEEVVVVTSPAYRSISQYLKRGPIPKVLVFPAGCFYRRKLENYLADRGFEQLSEMEFGTFDGIIGCVSAGLGITMLPRSVVERTGRRDEVRIHGLPKEVRVTESFLITRKGEAPSTALERLIEIVAEQRERGRAARR